MPPAEWPLTSSENEQTSLSKELLQLQWKMNTALAVLLKVRASMDHHHRMLDSQVELAVQLAEANACHVAAAAALHQTHLDSSSALNHEVIEEEGLKHQAFARELSATQETYP